MIEIIFYKKETRLLEARFFFVKNLKQVQDDDGENRRYPFTVYRPSSLMTSNVLTHNSRFYTKRQK